jgi:hypothetical protein
MTLVLGVALVASLGVATARVQEFRVRPYLHTNLYLPSGKFVAEASLGYRELAADLVWFQAVQYFGGYAKSQHNLAYFDALIGIVTDLDPHFKFPYLFGAVVMAEDLGDLDRGVALLKKGMVANPGDNEFPFQIGFLQYIARGDAESAVRYFKLAGRLPGGHDRADRFAAFAAGRSGRVETSIRMWEEVAASADQPYMRELAKRYVDRLRRTGRITEEKKRHDG